MTTIKLSNSPFEVEINPVPYLVIVHNPQNEHYRCECAFLTLGDAERYIEAYRGFLPDYIQWFIHYIIEGVTYEY